MRKSMTLEVRLVCVATVAAVLLSGCGDTRAVVCGSRIGYGGQVTDRLRIGDRCRYTFAGERGDVVTITMRRLGGRLDPRLELQDPDYVVVAENEDYGDSRDSQIRSYMLEREGTYTIVAGAYNDEGAGQFELALRREP
jgi:hypothetical protein